MNLQVNKRVMIILSLAMFLLIATACGNDDKEGTESSDGGSTEDMKSHNLIISHFLPGNHPIQEEVLEGIGATLEEETDGRITYEVYPGGALATAESQYDMAVTGEADVAMSVHGYTPGRFPLVSVLELPFISESSEHGSEIISVLYDEFPELKEEHNDTEPLFLFAGEPAQIISVDHKIETPEDLKGLRVRTPSPIGSDILEALDASPVSIPMGEVYEALERGVIDAAMVTVSSLYDYNFHEIVKYVTIGNFSATPFFTVMNEATYNDFSDEDRELLDNLTGVEAAKQAGRIFDETAAMGRELSEENDAQFIELTESELESWEKLINPVVNDWIEEIKGMGLPGQEIYDRALELKEELKN